MLEDYKDVKELVMDQQDADGFEKAFARMERDFKKYGLQPTGLTIKASQHALVSEEHVYGDGQPFFVLTVEVAGAAAIPENISTSATPTQQAMWLAREIGMNLMPNMTKLCGVDNDEIYAGSDVLLGPTTKYAAYLRCDPVDYCLSFNLHLQRRLSKFLPQVQTAPKVKQGGPAI